ncbi:MAG: threonine--tRNA ligase, partial [Thermoplasmatales archaeon]|nr:threonine--tRNA ligase [Thermoplasmatales archaeon]
DWCSYAAVKGDEEAKSCRKKVFVRSEIKDIEMNVDELVERIKKESEGKPFRPLYLPAELSKRCDF